MVKLWVSCKDHDDLDVRVQIRKLDKNGKRALLSVLHSSASVIDLSC